MIFPDATDNDGFDDPHYYDPNQNDHPSLS